jgi:hypothetical protein
VPGFDDKLTRELERAARPAAPDVVRTLEDVTRRRAHRAVVRRVQAVAVVVAILAGTAGAFALLGDRFEDRQPVTTETIAPPYHQMSSWRLQVRPVLEIGDVGQVTCAPVADATAEEGGCTEEALDLGSDVSLWGADDRWYVLGPAFADASDVSIARAIQLADGEWAVEIQLDLDATAALETATAEAVVAPPPRNRIAAVLDGEVVMAPAVQEPTDDGSLQVTGLGEEGSAILAAELSRGMPPATPSETPSPEGQDIGLAFRMCEVERLGGLDLLGDGSVVTAYAGRRVTGTGCVGPDGDLSILAVDLESDGTADTWVPLPRCVMCRPFGAMDLDGDGADELFVLLQASSTPEYGVYRVGSAGEIVPVPVVDPGYGEWGFTKGEPFTIWAGGDEGTSYAIACEADPGSPSLVLTQTLIPVDAPADAIGQRHTFVVIVDADGARFLDAVYLEFPVGSASTLPLPNEGGCPLPLAAPG